MEFNKISEKWQKKWEAEEIFKTTEDKKKEKCYVLEMFPYPSSDGLHMGHAFNSRNVPVSFIRRITYGPCI